MSIMKKELSKARKALVRKLLTLNPDISYADIVARVAKDIGGPPMSSSTIATIKRKMRVPMIRPRFYDRKPKNDTKGTNDKNEGEVASKGTPPMTQEQLELTVSELVGNADIKVDEKAPPDPNLAVAIEILKGQLNESKVTRFVAIKSTETGEWQIAALKEEPVVTTKTVLVSF